jgi:nitroimidazol reductase NimA-like FMN-containing flavoprotein (pyridoxamine 5'-phosphate oxidase superfamily)
VDATGTHQGQAVPDAERPVLELSDTECWDLLDGCEFGRLAFRLVDEVHLVPLNYVVDGRTLLFRTAPGSKLFAAALESDAAFEIDHHEGAGAWSVVVRGALRRLTDLEAHRIDGVASVPWVPTQKAEVVELAPVAVTGRRFFLDRTV